MTIIPDRGRADVPPRNARTGRKFQQPDGVPYHRSTGNTADLQRGECRRVGEAPLRNGTTDNAPNPTAAAGDPPAASTCFDCDAETATTRGPHKFIHGVGGAGVELTVEVPIHVCPACGLEFLDEEAETIKHDAVCAHLGVLTPDDIRGIRRRHGMSTETFAEAAGLPETALLRWEQGLLIQSAEQNRRLRLVYETQAAGRADRPRR